MIEQRWNRLLTFLSLLIAASVSACGNDDDAARERVGVNRAPLVSPDSSCTLKTFNGHSYWFCNNHRSWSTARSKCQAQGLEHVRINDAGENTFVKANIDSDTWIGANDQATEGVWIWARGGDQFWSGGSGGSAVGGLYSNWGTGEPGIQDCGQMVTSGRWQDDSCGETEEYICESNEDSCQNDPLKNAPGICGCGTPDTDSDADGIADCKDGCPNDAARIAPGDCGCANAPLPAGTACNDGLCAANTQCNGAGVCGNPSVCPAPDSDCEFGFFRGTYYWFCENDRPFANATSRCQSIGMELAVVESAAEDDFITDHTSEHTFVGGTDAVTEGTWVWTVTGQTFWTGGPSGSAVSGAYTNWESGQPSDGVGGRDCMVKDPIGDGKWETRACTTAEAFACERVDLCPDDPDKLEAGQCGCGNPEDDFDGDDVANCVDACPVDADKSQPGVCGCGAPDVDADSDNLTDCIEGCPNDPTNAACDNDDALPPAINVPGPPAVTPVDQSNCNSEAPLPDPIPISDPPTQSQLTQLGSALATMRDTALTNGTTCEEVQALSDCPLDPAQVKDDACTSDAECQASWGANYVCSFGIPTTCSGVTPVPLKCLTKQLNCGLRDPKCAEADPVPLPDPTLCQQPGDCPCTIPNNPACACTQFDVCSDFPFTGSSGPDDPNAYVPTPPSQPQAITNNQQGEPDPEYKDLPNDPACPKAISGDCWCKLGLAQPPTLTEVKTKPAKHGSNSVVELEFDPNLRFDVNVSPLAFGESNFTADAAASFLATVSVNLPLMPSASLDLIDLAAGVHAARCSISTLGTRFKVLEKDFIDFSEAGSTPFTTSSSQNQALFDAANECNKAVGAFTTAADQAKKALKDAQQLVLAYGELPADRTFERQSFCDALASDDEELGFSATQCETQTAAETINQFIRYYNENRIPKLRTKMQALAQDTADLGNALRANDSDSVIRFLEVRRHESETVARQQFFVGPIPVNVTLDVGLDYGVTGDLFYRYSPVMALALTPNSSPAQIAAVGGKLKPSAGSSLELFAGVGFDVPGFAVKAGISGELVLAELQGNLESGVGLSVRSLEDARETPSPLDQIGTSLVYFQPREYEFFLDWFYGASVGLPRVLDGTINAKVKLKAFFFSKTYKKTLIHFGPAFSLPETRILEGGNQIAAGLILPVPGDPENSLGIFEMQIPLVELKTLPVPASDAGKTPQEFDEDTLQSPLHYVGVCDREPIP